MRRGADGVPTSIDPSRPLISNEPKRHDSINREVNPRPYFTDTSSNHRDRSISRMAPSSVIGLHHARSVPSPDSKEAKDRHGAIVWLLAWLLFAFETYPCFAFWITFGCRARQSITEHRPLPNSKLSVSCFSPFGPTHAPSTISMYTHPHHPVPTSPITRPPRRRRRPRSQRSAGSRARARPAGSAPPRPRAAGSGSSPWPGSPGPFFFIIRLWRVFEHCKSENSMF